jgi:hypothetical protein
MPAATGIVATNPINISTGAAQNQPDPVTSNEFYPTLPQDIPVFGVETSGSNTFLPATAESVGSTVDAWNPWTHAQVAQMKDWSMPAAGPDNYGEPSGLGLAGSFVGTWGGMPYPLLDFNNETPQVAIIPRSGPYPANGPAGAYYGQQQAATAVMQDNNPPTIDYWSALLGVG